MARNLEDLFKIIFQKLSTVVQTETGHKYVLKFRFFYKIQFTIFKNNCCKLFHIFAQKLFTE